MSTWGRKPSKIPMLSLWNPSLTQVCCHDSPPTSVWSTARGNSASAPSLKPGALPRSQSDMNRESGSWSAESKSSMKTSCRVLGFGRETATSPLTPTDDGPPRRRPGMLSSRRSIRSAPKTKFPLRPPSVMDAGSTPSCGRFTRDCSRWWSARRAMAPTSPASYRVLRPNTDVGAIRKSDFCSHDALTTGSLTAANSASGRINVTCPMS